MSAFDNIDAALGKMQDILLVFKQQDPDYYAKYPVELTMQTDEQEVNAAIAQWKLQLPEDYIYFLQNYNPKSLYWNNDHYMSLHIYSAQELAAGAGISLLPTIILRSFWQVPFSFAAWKMRMTMHSLITVHRTTTVKLR